MKKFIMDYAVEIVVLIGAVLGVVHLVFQTMLLEGSKFENANSIHDTIMIVNKEENQSNKKEVQ